MRPIKRCYRVSLAAGGLAMLAYLWLMGRFEFSAIPFRAYYWNAVIVLVLLVGSRFDNERRRLPPL